MKHWFIDPLFFILSFIVSYFVLTYPAKADTKTWFMEHSGNWSVVGLDDNCMIATGWPNGSYFSINNSLETNTFFLTYHNPDLKFTISVLPSLLSFNEKEKQFVKIPAIFEQINDNIIVSQIDPNILILFSLSKNLLIILPGNYPSIFLDLKGSTKSIELMNKCIKKGTELGHHIKKGIDS